MPTTVPTTTVPTLDLGALPPEDLRDVARDLGAFVVTGHGIRTEVTERVADLARLLFALPEQEKVAIASTRSEQFRGWTSFGSGFAEGWREQFDVGAELPVVPADRRRSPAEALIGPNQWPARLPELRDRTLWFQDRAGEVARALLRRLAAALMLDPDTFDRELAGDAATWTTLTRDGGEAGVSTPAATHVDPGLISLHWIGGSDRGIQILDGRTWLEAAPTDGAFLVTIGEDLEDATDGYLRAAPHRSLPADAERIGITFTFDAPVGVALPHLSLPDALVVPAWADAA